MSDETERLCTALEHAMGIPPVVRNLTRHARTLAAENERLRERIAELEQVARTSLGVERELNRVTRQLRSRYPDVANMVLGLNHD